MSAKTPQCFDKLTEMLRQQLDFPSLYQFRFIIPSARLMALKHVLSCVEFCESDYAPSKKGNYFRARLSINVELPEEIVAVYKLLEDFEGLISL